MYRQPVDLGRQDVKSRRKAQGWLEGSGRKHASCNVGE